MQQRNQSLYKIPVMKPQLPVGDEIAPYIQQIDNNRFYTNFGPLLIDFNERLARFFNVDVKHLITVVNGTTSLLVALKCYDIEPGKLCIMPSWTFKATYGAAQMAGLQSFFVDVDEKTWSLDPKVVAELIKSRPNYFGAVIVVMPFGIPVDIKAWEAIYKETGVPVIIDAAAGFDTISMYPELISTDLPVIISLHATKPFGIGEGGIVISRDERLIYRIRKFINFNSIPLEGAHGTMAHGINAKMSEYTAAVGHAALDGWTEKRNLMLQCHKWYIDAFSQLPIKHNLSLSWVSSTCNITLPVPEADVVATKLFENGVSTRKWWGNGCHSFSENSQDYFLPITDMLAASVLGVPMFVDLSHNEITYVVECLEDAILTILAKQKEYSASEVIS